MAHLAPVGACIDRYEAVIDGEGRAAAAEPAAGRVPSNAVSWPTAERACRNAGFRLCTSREWRYACSGSLDAEGGRSYPYGDEAEPARCNVAETSTDVELAGRRLAPGGAFERCVTAEGVHDLSGNVGEWLADADPTRTLRELRGGSYGSYQASAGCADTHAFQPPDIEYDGVGFRCCADAR